MGNDHRDSQEKRDTQTRSQTGEDPDRDPTNVHSNTPPHSNAGSMRVYSCKVECTCCVIVSVYEQVGAVDVMFECEGLCVQ